MLQSGIRRADHWALQLTSFATTSAPRALLAVRALSGEAGPVLSYEETEAELSSSSNTGEATGLIVHGLLGSGRNWRSFSRALANDLAAKDGRHWKYILADQRGHGSSVHLPIPDPPSTVAKSAQDVKRLIERVKKNKTVDIILGHSLGGKVVQDLLTQTMDSPPSKQVWILDSVVGAARSGKEEPSDVKRVLDEIGRIPTPVPSRDWLYTYLESRGFTAPFRLWMGSNLTTKGGKYEWTFDVNVGKELYESYQESAYWDLVQKPPRGVKIHIVRGAKSDRWSTKTWQQLQEAAAKANGAVILHILPDAGHWLHADNPDGLRKLIVSNYEAP